MLALIVFFAVVLAIIMMLRGVAMAMLWHWYAEPLGLPGIGIAQAIGIGLLVTITVGNLPLRQEKLDDVLGRLGLLALQPIVLFCTGWLIKVLFL
jgi:hypothetical protein